MVIYLENHHNFGISQKTIDILKEWLTLDYAVLEDMVNTQNIMLRSFYCVIELIIIFGMRISASKKYK